MSTQLSEIQEKDKPAPWDETIRTVLIALLLALLFRSFAYEPFHIPSGSMKQTLLVGDYLFVSKYTYGYSRYSFPLGIAPIEDRLWKKTPQRGDIVVFRLPSNTRIDYIKRVMGVPGDHIQVRGGRVYLNGKVLPREPLGNYVDDEYGNQHKSVPQFQETLPDGKNFHILKERNFGLADETEEFVVPEGTLFMMGDNRDNSTDSRFSQVGFIPLRNVVGRAEMIFFSIDDTAHWYNPFTWFGAMRFGRFFKTLN